MDQLLAALKSDTDALESKRTQIAEFLSVDFKESSRIEALNLVYSMQPIMRDVDARIDGLRSAFNLLQQAEAEVKRDESTRGGQSGNESQPEREDSTTEAVIGDGGVQGG